MSKSSPLRGFRKVSTFPSGEGLFEEVVAELSRRAIAYRTKATDRGIVLYVSYYHLKTAALLAVNARVQADVRALSNIDAGEVTVQ